MRPILFACLSVTASAGCMTYSPQQVAALSTYEICETEVNQRPNLAEDTRRLLQAELARRKESCAPHVPAIEAARERDFYDQVYGNQSP